jgi:hypothetical protein
MNTIVSIPPLPIWFALFFIVGLLIFLQKCTNPFTCEGFAAVFIAMFFPGMLMVIVLRFSPEMQVLSWFFFGLVMGCYVYMATEKEKENED